MQTLTLEQLRVSAETGGVADITLLAQGGEFYVRIRTSNNMEAVLSRSRSTQPRSFPNPLPAMTLLRKLGLWVGTFDVSNWDPDQKPLARLRPDRAQAMKHANEAMEHDRWFRAQVTQGITAADNSSTQWVTNEQAKSSWAEKRAELIKRDQKSVS